MRYTTTIDITEMPQVYRNQNARLLYFHLCLKCGYHDDDRDVIEVSLRRLADDVGLTLSATRHSLKILMASSLIRMEGSLILVKKWVDERPITKRTRSEKSSRVQAEARAREERDAQRAVEIAKDKEQRARLEAEGLTSFIVFFEKKFAEYQQGENSALASLKRNISIYLEHCKQVKRKPIIDHI